MSKSFEKIESSTSRIENISSSIVQCLEYSDRVKALRFTKKAIIRQYYFEVCQNLEFIHMLNLEESRDFKDIGTELGKIMNCISIDMATAIMYLNNSWSYRKVYKKFKKMKTCEVESFEKCDFDENVKNLYDAMVFTIKKINILKIISSSGLSSDYLHNIRVRDRLKNIYSNLLTIRSQLKQIID